MVGCSVETLNTFFNTAWPRNQQKIRELRALFKHDSTGDPISGINECLFHFISRVAANNKKNLVHSELIDKILLTVVTFLFKSYAQEISKETIQKILYVYMQDIADTPHPDMRIGNSLLLAYCHCFLEC